MEFRKILEEEVKNRINDDNLRILKIAYIRKSNKLKIFYMYNCQDCKKVEESMSSSCREILKSDITMDFSSIVIEDEPDMKNKDHIRNISVHTFSKDPLAKRFFDEADFDISDDNSVLVKHYNLALTANIINKKSIELLEEIYKCIFNNHIKVNITTDESLKPIHEVNLYDVPHSSIKTESIISPSVASKSAEIQNKKAVAPVIKEAPKKKDVFKEDKSDDSVVYGKAFKATNIIPIDDIDEALRNIIVEGQIFKKEERELKSGKILVTFYISDNTSSISCKIFADNEESKPAIKEGMNVRVKGNATLDAFTKEMTIMASAVSKMIKVEKVDNAEQKRVELHAHTTMSSMDAVVSAKTLVNTAKKWGHPSIAITDHGVVQAFPEAQIAAGSDYKVIYGVEAYVADDETPIYTGEDNRDFNDCYVIFDIETTGFSSENDMIIEIGAVKIENKKIVERFSRFIDPKRPLPPKIVELTKITDSMLKGQPEIEEVLPEFLKFSEGAVMVAHNANFDMGFIRNKAKKLGYDFKNKQIDTVFLARYLFKDLKRHRLNDLAKQLNIFMGSHHRAVDDAQTTVQILERCFEILEKNNIFDLQTMNEDYFKNLDIRRVPSYHTIVLAKNQEGLKRLYELISDSHLKYFFRNPRIPKSILRNSRENLILGAACSGSELFSAITDSRSEEDIEKIADFYDYLEIQPMRNNQYLIGEDGKCTEEQIREINKFIIELGRKLGKLTCATGDVHMLKMEDEIYRRILLNSKGFSNVKGETSPLPFLTTEEMLNEFSYLGHDLAFEVVVTNTNKIAEMTEFIKPIPDETYPPKWEGAEKTVEDMVLGRAHEIYGDPLPEIVQKRVDRELSSIIGHGYAVLYLVAHKLVKKSLDDNYLVGSRGSVGSSLVATFMDITEVNGLVAHYVCPNCKHSEFMTEETGRSGVDLPDKNCPVCGTLYKKDGHDIPFETFLGFDGDKEPDIDLNFSGVYQPEVHKYCEVLFGEGYVFRAGTIGTVAEKTAMGYVRKYFEETGKIVPKAEMERLAMGCTGVKRTTGQHPGGIMVVPADNDIHNFCPVQKPADDTTTETITTHFDYHSISGRLLKLDILGHDDPTMLKMLHDLTGLDPKDIPLNDEKVVSLFSKPDALGVTKEELGCPVGTYGIPEFGTKFVMQMLLDTNPKCFADLVRISGLSHGTDVWLNNAQYYIKNGDTDLEGCISLRDNIMLYLISKGIEKKTSFFITEKVRKGKGLTEEHEKIMRENNVPEWYIESCKKIKYMFPKGHAVAYVTMASRIAYYKVYYPMAYYATFFTVRAKDFDAELVMQGEAAVKKKMDELHEQGSSVSVKDGQLLTVLELVYEMMKRGFNFENVDLYKSHAEEFIIDGNNLILPFNSVVGVGDNAAYAIEEEAKKGEFYSKEDFRNRTKSTRTVVEALDKVGCFKDLGDTNQISFF